MLLDLIKERCCTRSFSEQVPDDEKVLKVLNAARLAPSWMNIQPWHFIVIKDAKMKSLLSKLSYGQLHVAQAPVIIACCGDLSAWEQDKFKKHLQSRPGITQERLNALLSLPVFNPDLIGKNTVELRTLEELTYAVAYMTLEAEEQGLAACIIGALGNELTTGLPDVYSVVKEELNLPKNMSLMTLLLLGYSNAEALKHTKERKSLEEIVSYEKFGK